jgi:hypothetical protein
MKIPEIKLQMLTDPWALHKEGPELELLDRPCEDCAVTCGFYLPYSQDLSKEPKEIQLQVSKRWFCHNDRRKACRGNWNYLKLGKENQDVHDVRTM